MSTPNLKDFAEANAEFMKGFKDGKAALPPTRKVAVVTCMDARIHIEKALGLNIGDAHVIRNAGGSVSPDALRSLVISEQLLGTQEILIIKHTDCGMLTFDNPSMVKVLEKQLGKEAAEEGKDINWLTFKNLEDSVKGDVQLLKNSKLVPDNITISGHIYDVTDGSVKPVA